MVSDHDVHRSTETLDTSQASSLQSDYSLKNGLTSPNGEKKPKYLGCFCDMKFIPCSAVNSSLNPAQLTNSQCPCQSQQNSNNPSVHKHIEKKPLQNNPKTSQFPKNEKPMKNRDVINNKNRDSINSKNRDSMNSKVQDEPFKVQVDSPSNEEAEKVEIYYFDHGNSAYYHTTDMPPVLNTDKYADKGSAAATKFWARIFGLLHIGTSFVIAFVLQLLRFVLFSLVRPLTIGVIQLLSDYFLKPLLTIIFNGCLQPFLILFYNVATSFRDCCEPLAAAAGFYIKELAVLFRACRLAEVNHYPSNYT